MVAVAALLLLVAFVQPLWLITLEAPQYPEGLGLEIWVNQIRGQQEHNLRSINSLNHYIGMKEIEPDSIPELRFMPWILTFLSVCGLAVAVAARRWMLAGWLALLAVAAVAGLVDFYLWGYDYGHNLDQERAILKVPGMTYQPPLIGVKQLLNFKAYSWPGPAAWAAGVGALLAAAALVLERRRPRGGGAGAALPAALLVAAAAGSTGCAAGPRDIRYGEDACAHCRMSVSDPRYGTEIVTRTGRQLVFDAIECLAAYLEDPEAAQEVRSLWVTDFRAPETLLSAETAFYLRSPALPSPMGMHLTAFATDEARAEALATHGGEALDWPGVLAVVRARPARGAGGGHAHPGRHAH